MTTLIDIKFLTNLYRSLPVSLRFPEIGAAINAIKILLK